MSQKLPNSNVSETGDDVPAFPDFVDEAELEGVQGGFGNVDIKVHLSSVSDLNPAKIVNSALSSKLSLSGGDITIDSKI